MRQPFNRHRGGEMAWEKKELIKNILIIILLSGAFILFISRTGQGGTQKYFEGEVLENNGGYITIEVNLQYNDLIEKSGEYVEIDTEEVLAKRDFSVFKRGEEVRGVYDEFDSLKEEFEHVYAIYLKSEIIR